MKHLGDITQVKGSEVPIVDIVTGGSPCQDLSVAGKRAGLAGERSGLFMEQIRIIKEMREHDRNTRAVVDIRLLKPRFMVWENVPGAFSSNKGEDFRAVLEETARIAEKDAVIPRPENGKWSHSGCIMGDGWSIAWRVHDAQFWGVPQRRKRIALVADFGGQTAPEILFERKGVSGDIEESGETGEGAATDVRSGIEETGRAVVYGISPYDSGGFKSDNPYAGIYEAETARTLDLNGGSPACNQGGMAVVCATTEMTPKTDEDGVSFSLRSRDYKDPQIVCLEGNGSRPSHKGDGYAESDTMYTLNSTEHHAVCVENHPADSRVQIKEDGVVQTLSGRMGTGGGNVPLLMDTYQKTTGALMASGYDKLGTQETANDMYVVQSNWDGSQVAPTLTSNNANGAQRMPDKDNFNAVLTYGLDRASFNQGKNAQYDFAIEEEKIGTQVAKGPGAVCQSIVRRLTPLECERLQGFPDHWTDIGEWVDTKGKVHKDADSPRYKALGNSIALPFWQWMAERVVQVLKDDGIENPTLASLFDGIGGFPLVFSRCGCEPIWASEIEEFPIAVTKLRFPEKENNDPKEGESK